MAPSNRSVERMGRSQYPCPSRVTDHRCTAMTQRLRNTLAALHRLVRQQRSRLRTMADELSDMERAMEELHGKDDEPPPGIHDLLPIELAVIRAVVHDDDKYNALWERLGLTKRTFEKHLDSIFTKLGVRKRSALVRVAMRWGLA